MINNKLNTHIFVSSIILFLIGSLLHFTYDFFNNNFLVGLITPINESVGEHLKLSIFPIVLWWMIFYLKKGKKYSLDKSRWFLGCLVSIVISNIIVLGVYYFIRYGLDVKSLILDIMLLYIALLFGQFTGYHIYNYSTIHNFYFPIIIIYVIIISVMILTINPPQLPLFKDPITNTYGIYKQKEE